MFSRLVCLVLIAVAPSALSKSMPAEQDRAILANQVGDKPWWCKFVPEKPECQKRSEEDRAILANQVGDKPWWCKFVPEKPECQKRSEEGSGRQMADMAGLFETPSAESREVELPAPFGGSGAAHTQQVRDVHQDNFMETLKTAAREFQDNKQMPASEKVARATNGARTVVTCVYCDSRCVARAAASGYATAKDYFDIAIGEMNRIVQGGLDENMSFELTFVLLPNTITEMSWFFDYSATSSEELLTAINNKFWKDSGLYNMASSNGCDVDFLAVAPEDPGWRYMGAIEGIANMFQLCLNSYSTVFMNPNPNSFAKLATHEFGHMIGIYHDGALQATFSNMASYFEPGQMMGDCKAEYDALVGTCTVGDYGCDSGRCIMAATIDGTDWSGCSKAYYSMYNCLVGVDALASFYDDSCVNV